MSAVPAADGAELPTSPEIPEALSWLYRSEAFAEDIADAVSTPPESSASGRAAAGRLWSLALPAMAVVIGVGAWLGLS